jgi:hypothetical protein
MDADALSNAVASLERVGLATPGQIQGCSVREISEIEALARPALPQAYRQFLARMGRSAGLFLRGSDFLYPAVKSLKVDAKRLLKETSSRWALAPTDFVFVGHQGYEFLFFDCTRGEDPPVWRLSENEEPIQVYSTFSNWLSACVLDEIAACSED